ncbi:MAG: hypothetical protein EBT50_08685, partial [Verrucomicrobia bacterium]|nr:hypothetical protein [Verrucomicrobiota bacterium]
TFTRAAAGEILSRVLGWLARAVFDSEKRKQLGEISGSGKEPTVEECAEVLEAMTERMHRLQIGTMDGIFAKVARSFGPSVGMPPVWTIALPEQAARLAESAVDELLAGWEGAEVRKAWRKFKGKAPALGLRAQLMETFEEMRLDLCGKLRDAVTAFTAPKRGHWVKSLEKLAVLLSSPPRLVDLLEIGPVRKLALNEGKYDGVDIPANFSKDFSPWAHQAREEMIRIHQLRESALVALAEKYDRARGAQSYRSGSYTFREVEAAALQDLLLDEFQDTSRRQFSFFKPVLEETTGKGGHVLVVGDRKQSIYGWRGSDPRLLRDVEKVLPGVKRERLSESFRSSRAVLAAVDRAFEKLQESPLFEEKPVYAQAAAEWGEDYQPHKSSPQAAGQAGKVVLYVRPGSCADEVKAAVSQQVVERAKTHVNHEKGTLGILCRTHKLIPGILAGLKAHGIEASGEGGNPLTDSAAVEMILSLLSWADHPGHSAARYHVCAGGMAEVFGCGKVPAQAAGEDGEAWEFLKELRREIADR